jgi:hypothetical protein
MSNHFHLVIETPLPNLVAGMKWLLGVHAKRFNIRHKECGHLFAGRYKAGWRGATGEHPRSGAVTEEQRSQPAFSPKTLLTAAGVGSAVTARCGDAPASPPWPQSKSLAAGPHAIFRQALTWRGGQTNETIFMVFACISFWNSVRHSCEHMNEDTRLKK